MAFLDASISQTSGGADAPRGNATRATMPWFDAAERSAIAIGLRDSPSSLARATRPARWCAALFGLPPERSLTDARLESLRRLTLAVRTGRPQLIATERDRAIAAGVDPERAELLVQLLR